MKVEFMSYFQRIRANIKKIEVLDDSSYPNLYRLLQRNKRALKDRLLYILQQAMTIANQEGGKYGNWFFMPLSRFATDENSPASTIATWKKTNILFVCMGLVERQIPTEADASTPYRKKAIEHAKQHGHTKATAFYSVPEYTPSQLSYIDNKAKRWIEKKGNFQHFSKTTIIDTFGNAIADRVFQDERKKPRRTTSKEAQLVAHLILLLDKFTFTTKEKLFTETAADQRPDTPDELSKQYNIAKATWERCSAYILREAKAKHHRPTDVEKEQYCLTGNGWIITRTEEEVTAIK